MGWPEFFMLCFALGAGISLIMAISGAHHLPHLHLHWHGGAHIGNAVGSVFNIPTIAAFLLWFGGSGYLLTRFEDWRMRLVLLAATLFGLVGAGIVFWFLARVLLANERPLDPADYEMTGMLGRLSGSLRARGTGEMIFVQQGRRCGVAVRSESGEPLPGGTEVVVTHFEAGIAYVRTWDEMQNL